jgi:dTDP-4-amino-4,6-dideoxygalactose transaminase
MSHDYIPVANPGAQVRMLAQPIRDAIERVLSSGQYILGEEVRAFEQEFANFLGIGFCIGVANGTEAIAIGLKAVGVSGGDEVITVSHSAVATAAAIEQIGAVPVFADIDAASRCLAPEAVPPLVSSRTKAIVPVHIYGQPARMEEILALARHYNLRVVEDCAQAHGAEVCGKKVGTFGEAAAFSFYPTKNLGAVGDGGAVVTNSPEIAEQVRSFREYGWKHRRISLTPGVNSRLDELQAAILRVKLPHLLAQNARRREIAEHYRASIDGDKIVSPAKVDGTLHAMHLFVVECDQRESLQSFLHGEKIATARHYPMAIHQQPAYLGRVRGDDALLCTEALYRRILSLPMSAELSAEQVERVCKALREWSPR